MDFGKTLLMAIAVFVIVAGSVWAFDLNPFGSEETTAIQTETVFSPVQQPINEDNDRTSGLKVITSSGSGSDNCRVEYSERFKVHTRVCD